MAQEKPSALLAAQVWVADQRSRWNDLASLHLADIDLLLDKQLKWVNDHSDIDTLLSTLTIWADTSNDDTVTKSIPTANRQSINAFNEPHISPLVEHNITTPNHQSSVLCIELPHHSLSHTSTTSPNPITVIPEPTHNSDEKSASIDNNTLNVMTDVKIPPITNSLDNTKDDDVMLPPRDPSVFEEIKGNGQSYFFNDDYNNELSVELVINNLDDESQSHHDTSDDEKNVMVDTKNQEGEEQNLQHNLMEESIELDERPGIDCMVDYSTVPSPINVVRHEMDPDMGISEISTKENSHKQGTFFSDIQIVSHIDQDDESRRMSQTMKPIVIEDSPSSEKYFEQEFKNPTNVQELSNQNEDSDKVKGVDAALSIEEMHIHQPVHIDDGSPVSSLHELAILLKNEILPATKGLHPQQEDASNDDHKCISPRSSPKRSLAEMLSPSPDAENIRPSSPPPLNKVIDNTLSPQNNNDDIMTSKISNRPSDMLSFPKPAFKSASRTVSPLKDVQNLSHDYTPLQDDEKHTSSSQLKYVSSNDVSPLQNIENIKYISPPSHNDITLEDHGVPTAKSEHSTSLGSADHNDDEDDMDEVILVGAENSTKWTRPAPQRNSKMPAIQKDRHNKAVAIKAEKAAKSRKEPVSGQGKADVLATSKSQTKSLSLKKQKVPHIEKTGLPLDESIDNNVVSLAGNKQIAKRETGISASQPSAHGGSTFMKKLLGAYQDEKRKSPDDEIALDKLERGLEEVLQDVNRNSLEVNKSLCILDENRDYLHTKRDIGRQRHYMSPTVSRLKRLQVQETNQKLQSKLLAAQSTPRSMLNNHEKNIAKGKLTGAVVQSHMSNSKANSEHHNLQQPRKKRLGILNGRNAERLKIVQQRRLLQEKELVDGLNVEGKLMRSQESSQDSTKLAPSQSFAKATLSTQLKTHKPNECSSKATHNFNGTSKPQISTTSKSNETPAKQKPLDISHRNQQAHSQPKQTKQDINNPHQNSASNQHGISIPNTTTSDKIIHEDDPRPRKRVKLPMPGWAMSPELKQALEAQCTLNPEEIFGKMPPLRIEVGFSPFGLLSNMTFMDLCRADDLSPPATPPGSSISSSSPSPTLLTRPPQRMRQSYPDHLFGDILLQPSTLFEGCQLDHLQQIKASFQQMNALQKQYFLYEILNCCDTQQLNFVSSYIAPRLKIDFLKELPIEISLYILSFIDDPKTLARAARVSTFWNSLLKDETTWKSLCHKHHYKRRSSIINGTSLLGPPARRTNFSYRDYFKRKYAIEAAWENGGKVSTFLDRLDPGLVTSLQFDDDIIVAGCDNHKIEVFDARSGNKLRTMEGHEGGVWALQFCNTGGPEDRRILASGGCDRNVRVWDLDTGRLLHVLRGHTSTVRCLKLRDHRTAVTGSRDNTLRVWDIERGVQKFVLLGHQASVRCLEIHDNLAVSGSYDSTARIWDLDTGRCRHVLSGHYSQIYSIAFDGEKVITGSLDTNIRVWNATSGQCVATLHGHTSLVGQLQLSGHTLVSGGSDGCLRVWDIDSLECIHRISAHDNSVTCLQFDDRRIISGGNDGRTKLWDIKTGRLIRHLTHPAKTVWRLQFNDTKAVIVMQRRRSSNPDEGRSAMELHNFDILDEPKLMPDEDVKME